MDDLIERVSGDIVHAEKTARHSSVGCGVSHALSLVIFLGDGVTATHLCLSKHSL